MVPPFSYLRARSLDEALRYLSQEGARAHAGGTDLLGCLRERIFEVTTVVSIAGLKELRGIAATPSGGLRIGSLTTIAEIARHPVIQSKYRALSMAANEVASPQLRNQGTIGGNLCQKPRCWYYRGEFHCLRKGGDQCYAVEGENAYHCILGGENCFIVHPSDTAPALVALQASVSIAGPNGRRTVAVEDFHMSPADDYTRETVLEPAEIVTEIVLPPPAPGLQSSYRKVRARRSWDFALAGVALAVVFNGNRADDCRVVLSGAAPVPWRSAEAEKVVRGRQLNRDRAAQAAEAALENADPMEQNAYKIPLFRNLIEQQLMAIG
ncbi:MAG: xanthine dehydrogenase family protein subunit M [Deltaproteobacteria bacterium]|jgi:xanthine dehydrogenase YagS FAD-binding subunit|nr:xanthine dehydrogenase family protein subunit M [Deltaproteobacteria bacterium]MBW2478351.1 xanthine dehydrogenase family protein subunit M [Deltaproteobacteria bacterium]